MVSAVTLFVLSFLRFEFPPSSVMILLALLEFLSCFLSSLRLRPNIYSFFSSVIAIEFD